MQLSWHWPWAFLAGVIVVLAVAGVTLLVAARHKTDGIESARTFSLDDDLNTESASRLFRQWRVLSRLAVILLVVALALATALVARPSTVDEGEEKASSRDIVLCLDVSGSALPYDENVALTKRVVEYAHQHDVTVEGELGVLAGVEDEVASEVSHYTKPEEVVDFVTKTGVDSLAISIGTSHGANKFKPEQCTRNAEGILVPPELRFDILAEIEKELPGFPIVLHGSSSVPQEEVETINKYGGALKAAVGIPEEELRQAAKSAVCKINIDSDSRLAMTAAIREVFATKPAEFDPRKYLGPARDNMKKLYIHKIKEVLGSDGKAE